MLLGVGPDIDGQPGGVQSEAEVFRRKYSDLRCAWKRSGWSQPTRIKEARAAALSAVSDLNCCRRSVGNIATRLRLSEAILHLLRTAGGDAQARMDVERNCEA